MKWHFSVITLLCLSGVVEAADSDTRTFPIWGEEARARGYAIPLPFGINLSYMNMRQNIDVDSISFSGLALGNHVIPVDMFDIDAGHTREKSKTENLRLDMWVFPFLNIYGLVGHTRGSSVSNVSVDADPSRYTGIDRAIAASVHQLYQSGDLQDIDFTLDFKGTTWGTGITLAGGYENWFALVDTNYTRTDFDILDGKISALTISPRVGYRFKFQGPAGESHLSVWLGSMYQDVQQEFRGSLSDLHMPAALQPLINSVNQNDDGRFDVKQKLHAPWNMLIGSQFEMTPQFNILTEFGFNERNSFFVAGEYRF
ncbi:porin family protein [Lelliottia amnigena]|uniref:porin family protein n=1 Tax=Lelliottia amnigena TaxID=61646 RepID=UPI0021DA95F2|nr:porin family protein [Lelliottia amnigena]MCU7783588.1 porin family protein [Lelliottia amnigena]